MSERTGIAEVDTLEWGGIKEGVKQSMDTRLWMQLLQFKSKNHDAMLDVLSKSSIPFVLYQDLQDPWGLGLLFWGRTPEAMMEGHGLIRGLPGVELKGTGAMLGRTYSLGYEPELEHVLLHRPVEYATNPEHKFAIWYPLRRKGLFETLGKEEQSAILKEHAQIGMAYGRQGLAHDIRLASFGLDTDDNDFTVGIVGKDLAPLSKVVEHMRKTVQTRQYLEKLGPFFVGKVMASKAN